MTTRRLRQLGSNWLRAGGPLAGLLLGWTGAGTLHAQAPIATESVAAKPAAPESAPLPRNYLNKNNVRLPIQIGDSHRSSLQEVQLYIKEHRNGPWVLRDKVPPTQRSFTVHLPKDGEYSFAMVTVDKKGARDPEDLRTQPPGLVVVIDTQAPQVELTNLGYVQEGQLIQFEVRDANVDNARVRFAYQGGDRVFRALEPIPGKSNVYCIPVQAVCTGLIRASAEDLAGNTTVLEEHLSKIAAKAPLAANTSPPAAIDPPTRVQTRDDAPRQLPTQVVKTSQDLPPAAPPATVQRTPAGIDPTPVQPVTQRPDPNEGPRLIEHTAIEPTPVSVSKIPEPTAQSLPAKRQIVNSAKLFLDYQIENAGPSGVGTVEVWLTRDQGKTWTKNGDAAQLKSPVEVLLPGEGLFGVMLVASNGRGVAGAPPTVGDAPDWWVEVDTTKPAVEISKVAAVQENGEQVVHIQWTVQDKNLGDGPVELFYSATLQGPWLPIAKGLKAQGEHRWTPPAAIGPQAHVRLIAHDVAGNTTTVHTIEPVSFGPQARPRAVIRGISTTAPGN